MIIDISFGIIKIKRRSIKLRSSIILIILIERLDNRAEKKSDIKRKTNELPRLLKDNHD
jgi:hypothetical protein